nr:LysR family transcriptional regulator [Pseudomonas sp. VI4.1]
MNRNDLRRVDMNLLVIFETLMFEKNLTRAGEKLFLGQPAVSASLAKLRDLFDDPLLVRNGRVLEPTQRALQILKELQPAMDTISGAVSRAKDFDPSTSRDVFRIGLSDDAEFGLFPPLLKQMREEAQNVVVRRVNFLLMSSMLASGEISVGVSCTPELPAHTKRKKPCWPMLANRWPPPTSWPWTWRTIWTDQPQRPAGIAQVIILGELAVNRALDQLDPPDWTQPVGAGLLSKRPAHPTSLSPVIPPSRASRIVVPTRIIGSH